MVIFSDSPLKMSLTLMYSDGFAVSEVPRTLRNVENWLRESSAATRKLEEDSPKRSRLREEWNVASSVLFHSRF